MTILVKEVMSKPALTIDVNKTVRQAARLMTKHRKGYLIVTKKGKAIGILSDGDILRFIATGRKSPSRVKVGKIMSSPLVVASPEETIFSAVEKMKKNNIKRLPVVDKGKILGVISMTDVARASPEMMDLLEYRLLMKKRPIVLKEKTTVGFCENCGNYSERLREKNGMWVCEDCYEEEE